jgi:hypothetical protein
MTERWRKRIGIENVDELNKLQINGIAECLNQDLMRKLARCNYEAMSKTLQGYIV